MSVELAGQREEPYQAEHAEYMSCRKLIFPPAHSAGRKPMFFAPLAENARIAAIAV
jgi:hypothetical protein